MHLLPKNTEVELVHGGTPGSERLEILARVKGTSNPSITLQFGCLTEGVDANAFNAGVMSRQMGTIANQQFLGRFTRANSTDRKRFEAGEILLNSPNGWVKYEAVLYVIVHDEQMVDFEFNDSNFTG